MIGKSDLIILILSGALLSAGLYRWYTALPNSLPSNGSTAQTQTPRQAPSPRLDDKPTPTLSPQNASPVVDNSTSDNSPSEEGDVGLINNGPEPDTTASTPPSALNTDNPVEPLDIAQPALGVHIVKSGDSLSKLAARYDSTVETLQRLNSIEGSLIEVDQRIYYPLP